MGKYNKYYEDYYNKDNMKETKIEDDLNITQEEMQCRYIIRNREKRNKNCVASEKKKLIGNVSTVIKTTTIISLFLFIGVYLCQYNEKTKIIYEYVKSAISMEALGENKLAQIQEKFGLKIIDNKNENIDKSELKNNDKLLKLQDEKIKNTFGSLAEDKITNDEEDKNLLNEKIKKDDFKTDLRFKEFMDSLNGTIVKAKSETGVVLECKYKILANPIEGVISEIGENAEGHFLIIKHENEIETIYYNLPKTNLKKGQVLESGEKIIDIKEKREIVFKIKENNEFISPKIYSELIK